MMETDVQRHFSSNGSGSGSWQHTRTKFAQKLEEKAVENQIEDEVENHVDGANKVQMLNEEQQHQANIESKRS